MFHVIVTLAVGWLLVALVLWIMSMIPRVPSVASTIIIIFAIICSVFYLADVIGLTGHFHDIPVPKV